MRALLLLPLLLVACKTRVVQLPDGVKIAEASWGGKEYVYYKNNPSGTKGAGVTYIHRDDHNQSFDRAMEMGETVALPAIAASVQKAGQLADVATTKSNNARALGEAKVKADQAVQLGAQGVEKVRITTPP